MRKNPTILIKKLSRVLGDKLLAYPDRERFMSGGEKKEGFRFFSSKSLNAIRVNYSNGYKKSPESIDVWDGSNDKPKINIDLRNKNPFLFLKQIAKLIKIPRVGVYEVEIADSKLNEKSTSKVVLVARKGRPEVHKEDSDVKAAEKEIKQSGDKIDADTLYKDLRELSRSVARGQIPALLVTGMPGIGKSRAVRDAVGRVKSRSKWVFKQGIATPLGLYRLLYENKNKLIVMDDVDAVFSDNNSKSILKAALDSSGPREISWLSPNTINPDEISDEELKKGKLPSSFSFKKGSVIFISNIDESKIDKAILDRTVHINIHLSKDEVIGKIKRLMKRIVPNAPMDRKEEVLEFMIAKKPTFNIRAYVQAVKIRQTGSKRWKDLVLRYV